MYTKNGIITKNNNNLPKNVKDQISQNVHTDPKNFTAIPSTDFDSSAYKALSKPFDHEALQSSFGTTEVETTQASSIATQRTKTQDSCKNSAKPSGSRVKTTVFGIFESTKTQNFSTCSNKVTHSVFLNPSQSQAHTQTSTLKLITL